MMTPDEYRAARLRLWRGQAAAACALGISVATLSDREHGRAPIDLEACLALRAHEIARGLLPHLLAEAADLLDRLGVDHSTAHHRRATALATRLRDQCDDTLALIVGRPAAAGQGRDRT